MESFFSFLKDYKCQASWRPLSIQPMIVYRFFSSMWMKQKKIALIERFLKTSAYGLDPPHSQGKTETPGAILIYCQPYDLNRNKRPLSASQGRPHRHLSLIYLSSIYLSIFDLSICLCSMYLSLTSPFLNKQVSF